MIIPNCLSQALENYGHFAGTAASLFGCSYYIIVSAFTGLMSYMHNNQLTALPLFMTIVSITMMVIFFITIKSK